MADAGVVDEDAEAAELGDGGGDGGGVGYVEVEGVGVGDFGGEGFGGLVVEVGDVDFAPARASSLTVAAPMPLAPPVTRARRSSRRKARSVGRIGGCGFFHVRAEGELFRAQEV